MIIRNKNAGETFTRERCYIRELLNDPCIRDTSVAECRVAPGVTTELHRLSVAEWYFIREGQGTVEVGDGAPATVGPGDVVAIPPQHAQRITNTGDTDLRFLCLCMPAFRPGCYESLEQCLD